jgi:hypothetical protein
MAEHPPSGASISVTGVDQTARDAAAAAAETANAAIPKNAAITASGTTNSLVQYDTLGRVVGGKSPTADDIADGTDNHFVTTAEKAGMTPPAMRTIPSDVATDTFVIGDAWQAVESTNSALTTETIPPNSGAGSVAFDVGTSISLAANGTGDMLVVPGAGVTLVFRGVSVLAGVTIPSGQGATVVKTATNTWKIVAVGPKQDVLVSGTNLKTINGTSLLGSGNITVSAGEPDQYLQYSTVDGGAPDTVYDDTMTIDGGTP